MAKPSKDKVRVSLDISPDEHKEWLAIQDLEQSPTLIGTVRRALKLLRIMLEHYAVPGNKVIMQHKDGTDEILRLL